MAKVLRQHAPMLALPRWRVIADLRERFRCSDYLARQAYAIARKAVAR